MSQLSLFGPQDHAADLARGALNLAWQITQRRDRLTDNGFARVAGALAYTLETLDRETETRLAVPAIAELRERRRAAIRAPAPEPVEARPCRAEGAR